MSVGAPLLLKNAHVIDPQQNIDGLSNVLISNGKIEAVGADLNDPGAECLDLAGS